MIRREPNETKFQFGGLQTDFSIIRTKRFECEMTESEQSHMYIRPILTPMLASIFVVWVKASGSRTSTTDQSMTIGLRCVGWCGLHGWGLHDYHNQ